MSLKRVAPRFTDDRFSARSIHARGAQRYSERRMLKLWRRGMDDWDNFYMLAGGTGGTLIGLISW
jgi:hypothetical protein